MRRLAAFAALSIAALSALPAEAQTRSLRRSGEDVLILNVRPRSYLHPGNVVPVGSINQTVTGYGQTQSFLNLPPYAHNIASGHGTQNLPDPITNGAFAGARNPFGPIDFTGSIR
jgi:hypothetical protein